VIGKGAFGLKQMRIAIIGSLIAGVIIGVFVGIVLFKQNTKELEEKEKRITTLEQDLLSANEQIKTLKEDSNRLNRQLYVIRTILGTDAEKAQTDN
jgi:septal ring factor EnvC (AmiA/AmiB activator)